MGIFDIFVRKDKKSKKHFSQNGKNTEEAMLKKTAKSAPNPQERMQAVSEITDQDFLYEIAVSDNDFGVGKRLLSA